MLNKNSQTRLIYSLIIGLILIGIFFFSFVSADSFNPEDNRTIGYEFLDDNKVVHIWNTQDDYFFNKSSGIQFTNHFQDYWTRNIFCLGYYSGEEWIKIKCADELSNFSKDIQTDNLTYVNATLWKDISYGNYDLRLGVQYHLGLDDKTLSITIYGKNIGIDIPYDLGFAWKVTDIEIPYSIGGDIIKINNTNYSLSDNIDLTFKNLGYYIRTYHNNATNNFTDEFIALPYYKITDYDQFLRLDWNENLDYDLKLYSDGNQANAYVSLLINAGHFNSGQEKSTIIHWIDAAWNVSTAVYTNDSFSVNSEETSLSGVHFSSDGTKMYIAGYTDDEIVQYALSIAWNVSTASYEGDYCDVSNEEGNLHDLRLSADGTKMYIAGEDAGDVFQYSLSTAWNVSTCSYEGDVFRVATQMRYPFAIDFSSEGMNMYVGGFDPDKVFQYSLSTAWNVSTASYEGDSCDVSGEEIYTHAIFFKSDGTEMYMVGTGSVIIFQYSLSTAWNVSTCSLEGDSLDVSSQSPEPRGLFIRNNGGDLYVAEITTDVVFQYSLPLLDSTAPNVTINTPANITYSTSSINFNVTCVDDFKMDSAWVTIDGGVSNLSLTNTTYVNDYNATNTTVLDGSYLAQFYCNDSTNNINNSESKSFSVDTANRTFFYENWEAQSFVNWSNEGWAIDDGQAIDTYSAKCAAGADCDMNSTVGIDTSSAGSVNVSFSYFDDDLDTGEAVWYWKNSSGDWINRGNIDGGTLSGDDTWYPHSLSSSDSQYLYDGFAIRFWGNPGGGENYWVDNINVSTVGVADTTCPCPGVGNNWEIDMEDFCYISDNCVSDALTFINTGNFTCDAIINVSSVEGLSAGQRGYVTSNCRGLDR